MASEDQNREREGPSGPPAAPFQWGAVLSAVKDQIPSMDSDISIPSCDEDGELFIFQRDQSNLIPDLTEELEDISPEEMDLQTTFTFMRHPGELWNKELESAASPKAKATPQSVSGGHVLLDRDSLGLLTEEMSSQEAAVLSGLSTNEPKPGEGVSGGLRGKALHVSNDKGTCSSSPDMLSPVEVSPFLNASEEERRKLIETQILSKVMLGPSSGDVGHPPPNNNNNNVERAAETGRKPAAISAEHPRELLAFKSLEKWDLDKILQDLEKQSDGGCAIAEDAFPSKDHETSRALSQMRLMEKLEELSLQQSRAFFSHRRRRLARLPHFDECQGDGREVPILVPLRNGQSLTPLELQYTPEPPTVYIDLRDTTPQKPEPLAPEKQSSSDSSADDEEDTEVTGQGNTEERFQPSRKDCTGKSFLLQQLRAFRRRMAQSLAQGKEWSPGVKKPEHTDLPKVRRRQCLARRRLASMGQARSESHPSSCPLPAHMNSTAEPTKRFKKETEKRPGPPAEKVAEFPRASEIQKEMQGAEKLRKQRHQQQLESFKPEDSITGKQPMAEQTPVLFHMEASYLAAVATLPTQKAPGSEMLLMTVRLSSCGQVAPCSQANGSFPEASLAAANIYTAIVAWLLTLVSAGEESPAPFQVLGLQQAWHKDSLALRACLTPADRLQVQSSSRLRRDQPKEFLQGTSPFYQQVSMFLSHTSLSDAIWWKEGLTSQLQNQPYPLLPEIPAVRLSCVAVIHTDPAAAEKAFAVPAGFYWQTVETDEEYFPSSSGLRERSEMETEVAMTLLFETLFRKPVAVHHMLQLILASGLDICGLRLLYPQSGTLLSSTAPLPPPYTQEEVPPVVALSLRGPQARSVLRDIMGPSDPQLARLTDRNSINAIYGTSRAEALAYLPHTESRVHRELCVWFGGRVCCDGMLRDRLPELACKCKRARPLSLRGDADQAKSDFQDSTSAVSSATLVSTTKGDVILVASPAVPPHTYGLVISVCTQRGFALQGTKQLRLSPRQALLLRIPASQVAIFCPSRTSRPPERSFSGDNLPVQPHTHCLALVLRKENSSHHVPALLKGLMNGLAEKGFLGEIQSNLNSSVKPELDLCFHAVSYTETALHSLGGSFSAVPDSGSIPLNISCHRRYASDPEMEQIVLLTLTGKEAMKSAGCFLHQILTLGCGKQETQTPVSEESEPRFELLALKWLPCLTRVQAKEITPFEVGDKSWQTSLEVLMSGPALVCVLRRIGAFEALAAALKTLKPHDTKPKRDACDLWSVMSSTPEIAFRQAVLFFTERDFVGDPKCRSALKYLPPPGRHPGSKAAIQRNHAELIFHYMQEGAQLLCTVLLVKPGVWAGNLARILRKLNLEKFHLVGMKHLRLKAEDVDALLSSEAQPDPATLEAHASYLTSGFSLVLCLQRENAVKKLLDLLGPEDPKWAQARHPFFWRALYGLSPVRNGFYGSTSYCVALRDIRLFFPEGLCGAECPAVEEKEICTMTWDPVVCLEEDKRRRLVKRAAGRPLNFLDVEPPGALDQPGLAVLCQSTALILPETILQGTGWPHYVELLEQLIGQGFLVTGARLTMMNEAQARFISEILGTEESEAAILSSQLTGGSCLVLAVQRDNAVLCFDALLDSGSCRKQAVLDCMQKLLYPKTEKQAEKLLCCLFDSLTSESLHEIQSQDS
ncbi:dynein axonemal assembly factor 8-like isoform X2 [Hemicordylus capensis]|uniref:dynein axonemal assembly factor 8-like isoform X2 n=1 Tax=Hemicordylus capensis TaxID=884348 RepID=UPI002304369C|nr:dynein axonemal assembly factor 8-like isoform X2 [Hemicordylus capensis]